MSEDKVASATTNANKPTEDELPWLAKVVNNVLTPGSALSSGMWTFFNCIIAVLFLIWLTFLIAMPWNIHVYVFGGLTIGLAISTNFFMREVFAAKADYESQQKEVEAEEDSKKESKKDQ